MGVQPYLITTSINCVVAQRLVRKICQDCKQQIRVPPELLLKLGAGAEMLSDSSTWYGKGCGKCRNVGYAGRAPIYEVLRLDDQMRAMILAGASKDDLRAHAVRAGMITLRRAGLELVKAGITSIEEVLGATTDEGEGHDLGISGDGPGAENHANAPVQPATPAREILTAHVQPEVERAAERVAQAVPVIAKFNRAAIAPLPQAASKRPPAEPPPNKGLGASTGAPAARWKTSKGAQR
jgi:hypothetical protein